MKQYVIDQIQPEDRVRLQAELEARFGAPDLGGIYWLPLDGERLNPLQAAHQDCHPLCVALELCEERLVCELLIRTRQRMRCDCMGYADSRQRGWIMDTLDDILAGLDIKI